MQTYNNVSPKDNGGNSANSTKSLVTVETVSTYREVSVHYGTCSQPWTALYFNSGLKKTGGYASGWQKVDG